MKDDYTVEVYKKDRRHKSGWKLKSKIDYKDTTDIYLKHRMETMYGDDPNFKYSIHKTWVTRHCLLDNQPFQERYDVPYYCSPSSETFWSS